MLLSDMGADVVTVDRPDAQAGREKQYHGPRPHRGAGGLEGPGFARTGVRACWNAPTCWWKAFAPA
jgi:hypothetical protein